MLSNAEGFVRLPGERVLYTSAPRTTLLLQTPSIFSSARPLSISSSTGRVYLTNQRIVYLPAPPTPALQSFSAPILKLHDTHVSAPFFGPNVWTASLEPIIGGGIPSTQSYVEIKMVFKEGGAFDFHTKFERVKEHLLQALEAARDSGSGSPTSGSVLTGVNLAAVHLEQLPAYEEANAGSELSHFMPVLDPRSPAHCDTRMSHEGERTTTTAGVRANDEGFMPPMEPPPGYEEVQAQSVGDELERRLRGVQ